MKVDLLTRKNFIINDHNCTAAFRFKENIIFAISCEYVHWNTAQVVISKMDSKLEKPYV